MSDMLQPISNMIDELEKAGPSPENFAKLLKACRSLTELVDTLLLSQREVNQ